MVRIIIMCGTYTIWIDLPYHNGNSLLIGDTIDDRKLFGNLGPITVVKRHHAPNDNPEKNMMVVYCTGSVFLARLLFEKGTKVPGMIDTVHLPPQNWKPVCDFHDL